MEMIEFIIVCILGGLSFLALCSFAFAAFLFWIHSRD